MLVFSCTLKVASPLELEAHESGQVAFACVMKIHSYLLVSGFDEHVLFAMWCVACLLVSTRAYGLSDAPRVCQLLERVICVGA